MGLAENLAQGLASAAGATDTAGAIQKNKNDRRATAHEELEANSHSILNDVKLLQERRAALDPQAPGYQQDIGEIDKGLHDARQALVDLYHPAKNPGALEKLSGFIQSHRKGQQDAQGIPRTPAEAKERVNMAQLDATAAGRGKATPNPILIKRQQMQQAGFTPEQIQKVEQIDAGLEAKAGAEKPTKFQQQLTETTDDKGQKHYWRVPLEEGGKPEEVDFQGQTVSPKSGHVPTVGSFGDFLVQAYGPHPTAGQYKEGLQKWQQAHSGTTVGTHMIEVPQPDGSIKMYQVETSSHKEFGGAPSTPSPRSGGKTTTLGAADASVKVGDTVGGRLTAPQSKAKTEYDSAVGLAAKADLVAQHPNDAVNQKRLAVALERVAAGRFTTQALEYIVKAGWGNTIEGWANSATTGALPADVMRQLIDGAHQEVADKKAALDASGYKDTAAHGDTDDDEFLKKIK